MNGSHFYLKFVQKMLHTVHVFHVLELQNLDVMKYGISWSNSAYTQWSMNRGIFRLNQGIFTELPVKKRVFSKPVQMAKYPSKMTGGRVFRKYHCYFCQKDFAPLTRENYFAPSRSLGPQTGVNFCVFPCCGLHDFLPGHFSLWNVFCNMQPKWEKWCNDG